MSHLRFSPEEYQAVSRLCRPLDFNRRSPHAVKRLLAAALADTLPELARRIARMRSSECRILRDHLRGPRPLEGHDLTADELGMLADAGGRLLSNARFVRPLKGALARQFLEGHPVLAMKLERLSHPEFEALCEQVKERARRSA